MFHHTETKPFIRLNLLLYLEKEHLWTTQDQFRRLIWNLWLEYIGLFFHDCYSDKVVCEPAKLLEERNTLNIYKDFELFSS